ncbi:MAG: hypothetical protein HRT88_17620, partial [Lentisphaeraceae bacterium]|nr:hypothetical protein [Lentisphaeraceae bacterium]
NTKYGFAMHPLRDQEGVPLPINHDIKGTYPWMDRSGNNIVFTNIKSLINHDPDNPRYSNS